jgi:hypothetical protein
VETDLEGKLNVPRRGRQALALHNTCTDSTDQKLTIGPRIITAIEASEFPMACRY